MSVNGRPFKPDPTSYQMTGIPCGNPARFRSRGVIRMTQSSIPYENQQLGIPGQGTESAAEKELQNLIKNQFNASTDYSKKTVDFTNGARGGERLVPSAKGFMTLNEFQKVAEGDKESNQMRGLGFTDHQINHLLAQRGLLDDGLNSTLKSRKVGNITPNPDFVRQGIKEMMEARELKEAELEVDHNLDAVKNISRHQAQLESALLQGKSHPLADLYHKKAHGTKMEINNFTLEEYIVSKPQKTEEEMLLEAEYGNVMKRFKVDFSSKATEETERSPSPPPVARTRLAPVPAPAPAPVTTPVPAPTPEPPKPVVLSSKIESIPEETIKSNKAPEEEILKQFSKYDRGTPSKVLYVKNLDKQAGVKDLVSLFIRFQQDGKDKIAFKVMDGRMKGQAFVTFHDEPTATTALELVHGYIMNSKPLVIQYGKSK